MFNFIYMEQYNYTKLREPEKYPEYGKLIKNKNRKLKLKKIQDEM